MDQVAALVSGRGLLSIPLLAESLGSALDTCITQTDIRLRPCLDSEDPDAGIIPLIVLRAIATETIRR